jgi:tRNA dimethylallyltransferase
VESDPELRRALEARPSEDLRAQLERDDPAAAARIPKGDRVRTVRALEALALASRPISEQHARHRFADRPFELRMFGLAAERDALAARLRARVQAMFDAGLADEVRALHAAGYGRELRPLRAIGYREACAFVAGEIGLAEAIERAWIATRRYAKRQRTWFRAEPELEWLDADRPAIALERLRAELSRR